MSIKPKARTVPLPSAALRLDWREYFRGFMEEHGEPMDWHGKLIFADGWSYSATEYAGPEWPPPLDKAELRAILTAYWTLRLQEVDLQLRQLKLLLEDLIELRRAKSAPLKRRFKAMDDEGKAVWQTGEPDYQSLKDRLEWLHQDKADCKAKLKELNHGEAENGQPKRQAQRPAAPR